MQIKTNDGTASVSSAGVGGTGLGLGIAGTALGLLNGNANGNGILGGLFSNGWGTNQNQAYVSGLQSEIAKEKAERYADQVGIEVYKEAVRFNNNNIAAINNDYKELAAKFADLDKRTAVSEAVNACNIQCLQEKVAGLYAVTKLVVPNSSVCPGWGNVTITPSTTTTA